MGALVETPSLYPHLTGDENLEVTRRLIAAPRSYVARALAIVKMEQAAHRLVREYSLGMRQRLGLALALLNQPEVLILDEPTNGLDPAGIHEIRELLRRLPGEFGVTVFLSSHLLGEVEQVASHIGILDRGHLLFQGTLAELQAKRKECIRLGTFQPEMALQFLREAGWAARSDGEWLSVEANGPPDAARVNTLLAGKGVEVFYLATEQPTLENIFLQLTARARGEKEEL